MLISKSFIRLALVLICTSVRLYAQTNVLTYHNDNARTGQNITETLLTPASVSSGQFHKLYSISVDGYVFAQPLVLTNVNLPGQGVHNVVYAATENDSLYAIDADTGVVLWQLSFINPSAGITTIPTSAIPDPTPCNDVGTTIGITGTPVIDPITGTIYLVVSTEENGSFVQRLHAIDVATQAEKFGGPVVIQATVPGTGNGSQNGIISFNPLMDNQRPGLLLQNGQVIVGWASHCDFTPYQGWIMAYNSATLAQEGVFATTPNGDKGGVWMGAAGIAADSNFNVFVASGDGDYDGESNWGDSILELTGPIGGAFAVGDWFTPYNQAYMNTNNKDLGSGGVLLLPDLPAGSAHQQLLVEEGKLGAIYLIDRNNMGQYCSTCTTTDTQVVQELTGVVSGLWSMPAYWNGNVYFGGRADYVKALSFNANNSGFLSTSPTSQTAKDVYKRQLTD